MGIGRAIKNRIMDMVGESQGVSGDEEFATIRDPKPYAAHYSNGVFVGHNGDVWMYFKMPEDVNIDWTSTYHEAADNQMFLSNVFNSLGRSLVGQRSTRKDERYKFHIPLYRELSDTIASYEGITPAHKDFIDRMGGFLHPVWKGYLGIQLKPGSINSDKFSFSEKARNYIDFMMGNVDIEYALYKECIELVTGVCLDNGLRPLDFVKDNADYERLTGWFGASDTSYGVRRELETTPLQVPEHGKSIFCGMDELSFFAIRPKESRDMFMRDPLDKYDVRFGKALMKPSLSVVHINIRGEIRSPESTANLFDSKNTKHEMHNSRDMDFTSESVSERKAAIEKASQSEIATMQASRMRSSWLDNVETTVAVIVDGKENRLNAELDAYGLEAVNVVSRQNIALQSTVPCYPNPIFKVPRNNMSRNPNVRNFFPGVLSLSGLFRASRPAGSSGMLLGLSDSGYEFKEIFREPNAPNKYGKSPVILITGSPGSGKALPLDMLIPTPRGMVALENIHPGDVLFGPDGKPTTVTFESAVETKLLFELATSDGEKHLCDNHHQWIVVDNSGRWNTQNVADITKQLKAWNPKTTYMKTRDFFEQAPGVSQLWSSVKELEASLDFCGISPDRGRMVSARKARTALCVRMGQKMSTVNTVDERQLVRFSAAEMASTEDVVVTDEKVLPRFSIIPTQDVCYDDVDTPLPPYVAGFMLGCEHAGGTIRIGNETLSTCLT